MIPRYIRWQAALGRGDLHPGGSAASARLAEWVEPWRGGVLVEIGAGAGLNASRYALHGWTVVATEPDPVLLARCRERRLDARGVSAEHLSQSFGESVSVVLAESWLEMLDRAGFAVERTERLTGCGGMTRSFGRARELAEAARNPGAAWALWRARRAAMPQIPV